MKKKFIKSLVAIGSLLLVLSPVMIINTGCNKATQQLLDSLLSPNVVSYLASYLVDKEHVDSIPQDVVVHKNTPGGLPSSVDLTKKFPPIGDQGQYGTCVAWASSYNLKTALNGIEKGLSGFR